MENEIGRLRKEVGEFVFKGRTFLGLGFIWVNYLDVCEPAMKEVFSLVSFPAS